MERRLKAGVKRFAEPDDAPNERNAPQLAVPERPRGSRKATGSGFQKGHGVRGSRKATGSDLNMQHFVLPPSSSFPVPAGRHDNSPVVSTPGGRSQPL